MFQQFVNIAKDLQRLEKIAHEFLKETITFTRVQGLRFLKIVMK